MHNQSINLPFVISQTNSFYGFFVAILAVLLLSIAPLYLYAQADESGSDDLSATIKNALLVDPRARSLSPDQINTMVYALMQQATAQGMTSHDILWRPVLAHTVALGESPVADICGNVPAPLCALNRSLGYSGSDMTLPISLGTFIAIILALIAGYLELRHRNNVRAQV